MSMLRFVFVTATLALATSALAENLPKHVGECAATKVQKIETRLVDGADRPVKGSGSAVEFANGGYQVSYDAVPEVEASRPGDPVKICLVSIPRHCPPGDKRGRVYETTNLRTMGVWKLPDSEHACGGA
jgi:hypothetical protein